MPKMIVSFEIDGTHEDAEVMSDVLREALEEYVERHAVRSILKRMSFAGGSEPGYHAVRTQPPKVQMAECLRRGVRSARYTSKETLG